MLMRVIRFFLLFFPPWIVASADIFSFPWGGFLSQETMHFNLVRRGIILSKFEFYFCKEFVPFLHNICYSEAENENHLILRAYTFCFLYTTIFIAVFQSLCPSSACSLSLWMHFCGFIVSIKVLDSRVSLYPVFYLSNCVFFSPFPVSSDSFKLLSYIILTAQ